MLNPSEESALINAIASITSCRRHAAAAAPGGRSLAPASRVQNVGGSLEVLADQVCRAIAWLYVSVLANGTVTEPTRGGRNGEYVKRDR